MMNQDFRNIILQQQEEEGPKKWNGTVVEYMEMVQKQPEVSMLSPARVFNMIFKKGVEPVPENRKTFNDDGASFFREINHCISN